MHTSTGREAIEKLIKDACEGRDYERATTLVIEHYGAELLGFLVGQLHDADAGAEVFGRFGELFWKTLPQFEWRCSARTWAYKLARRTASNYRRKEQRHEGDRPLTQLSRLSAAVDRVRTATVAYLRTEVKDRFQELRAQLPEADQALLVLRVDRGLSWLELAEVMLAEDGPADAEQLKREAARLRKRFQLVKEELRRMVAAAGLLET